MKYKWFLFIALCLLFSGCAVNPVTGKKELALMQVSTEQEVALGSKSYSQALQQMGGVYPDQQLNDYINRVGQRLALKSHRPELRYQFKVVNDSSPNAFALPGGFIAITRGLLINLENEAQLAAVLGHEIGHVTARHSVQEMQRSKLLSGTVSLIGALAGETEYGPLLTQASTVTASLLSKKYSREQEFEADRLGIKYMAHSNYAVGGAVQLQQVFVDKLSSGQNNDFISGLFSTHPVSAARLAENQRIVREQYAAYNSRMGLIHGDYVQHIAPLIKTKAAYRLYDQGKELEAQGKHDQAVASYHKAVQLAPDHGFLLTSLGMAYLRNEDIVPARRYLLKAIQVDTDYFQSHLGLGYIYLQKKRYADATGQLEASLALYPTLQGTFLLGDAEAGQGHVAKARQLYQAVYSADSGSQLGRAAAERLKAL